MKFVEQYLPVVLFKVFELLDLRTKILECGHSNGSTFLWWRFCFCAVQVVLSFDSGWNRLNPVKQDILLCSVFSLFWTWDVIFRIWQLGMFKRYIEVSRRYMVQSLLRDLRGNVSCNLSPVLMSGNLRRSGISIPDFSDLWKDDYFDITEHREKLGRVGKITSTLLFSQFVPYDPRRSGFHKSGVTTGTGKVDELRSLRSFGILPT